MAWITRAVDEEQHKHDQDRNHGPGEFHLIASVNLRRLAAVIVAAPAKFRDGIHKQAEDDRKNRARDCQHQIATDERSNPRESTAAGICWESGQDSRDHRSKASLRAGTDQQYTDAGDFADQLSSLPLSFIGVEP